MKEPVVRREIFKINVEKIPCETVLVKSVVRGIWNREVWDIDAKLAVCYAIA